MRPAAVRMHCRCFIVPPHLFRGIAESKRNPESVRKAAQVSLDAHDRVTKYRHQRLEKLTKPRGFVVGAPAVRTSPFIPEGLLAQLSTSEAVDKTVRLSAKRDLEHLQGLITKAPAAQEAAVGKTHIKDASYRAVYDAKHTQSESNLPGDIVRTEGQAKVQDEAANEAFDNVGHVLDLYRDFFNWKSIDNRNADIISSVHFGKGYENAFWDPEMMQMVFGDGGELLRNFTGCIDVIGHELTHAVTEHTSPLDYTAQSGALNEHISDVFGIMVKQRAENETSNKADWLIGEYCLLPDVKGVALRSMKDPGMAYDDPRLGKDPQVGNMSQYARTSEDNGGVHIFSGIPNKAFYLTAVAFGGYSWEKAGQIWWKAMTCGKVPGRCSFAQFADVTVECAENEFGEEAAKTVRKAWNDVGVTRRF